MTERPYYRWRGPVWQTTTAHGNYWFSCKFDNASSICRGDMTRRVRAGGTDNFDQTRALQLIFELLDQPLSSFLRGLDSDVIAMTEALIPRASSECGHVLVSCESRSPPGSLQARIPNFEQRHGCRTSSFSAAHTAACLVLLRLLREARCRLCASPSH